jgi:WD40 repeat protein
MNARLELRALPDGDVLKELRGHAGPITSLAFSPDGQLLASGSADNAVRLWTVGEGKLTQTLGHNDQVWCLAWASNAVLLTGSKDGLVREWRVADGTTTREWSAHTDGVMRMVVTADGTLVGTGDGSEVRLWNLEGGCPLAMPEKWAEDSATFSMTPDGRFLAIGCWNGAVEVWRIHGRRQLIEVREHAKMVSDLALSADGKLLVSCSQDQTVRLCKSRELTLSALPVKHWKGQIRAVVDASLQNPETPSAEQEALEFIKILADW